MSSDWTGQLKAFIRHLQDKKLTEWGRRVPVGDLLTERDENARHYGFGAGTTMYDSVVVIGDVKVGSNTWIGPNVVLDGSGGLEIGDYCSISAGVQIYSHDTVAWATSGGVAPYAKAKTKIGSRVYFGPQAIVTKGVTIGDGAIIGALTYVDKNVASGETVLGRKPGPERS